MYLVSKNLNPPQHRKNFPGVQTRGEAGLSGGPTRRGAAPQHAARALRRTLVVAHSWSLVESRARVPRRRIVLGVASPAPPAQIGFGNFQDSSFSRAADEMSTNATAAIASAQGGGKAGVGGNGVSDSASVARRYERTLGTAAPARHAGSDTTTGSFICPLTARFLLWFLPPQVTKRAHGPDGASRARPRASRKCLGEVPGAGDPAFPREPPATAPRGPMRFFQVFAPPLSSRQSLTELRSPDPFLSPPTDQGGRGHQRVSRRGQHFQLGRNHRGSRGNGAS